MTSSSTNLRDLHHVAETLWVHTFTNTFPGLLWLFQDFSMTCLWLFWNFQDFSITCPGPFCLFQDFSMASLRQQVLMHDFFGEIRFFVCSFTVHIKFTFHQFWVWTECDPEVNRTPKGGSNEIRGHAGMHCVYRSKCGDVSSVCVGSSDEVSGWLVGPITA